MRTLQTTFKIIVGGMVILKKSFFSLMAKYHQFIVLVMIICFCGCDARYGFIESEFTLSPESSLPKWVTLPAQFQRKDLSMEIILYTHPIFRKVKVVLRGPAPDFKVLQEVTGDQVDHPLTKSQPRDAFPGYIVISVNGIEEIFEQRTRNSILYIKDSRVGETHN
jgi:hypothetical protein